MTSIAVAPWAARHPLTAFLLPVFVVGWPTLALLARLRRAHGPDGGTALGQPVEHWLGLGLVGLVLVPSALLVTRTADGGAGVLALVRRAFRWRAGRRWAAAVSLGLPAIALAFALLVGGRWRDGVGLPAAGAYAWSVLTRTVVINLWEELAWAGFAQTRLQHRHGVLVAALLTAVPFAAIHVPLALLRDGSLVAAFAGLLVLSAVFRLLVGVVLAGTGGSVLAAGVTHAVFNSTANQEGVVRAAIVGVDASLPALAAALVLAGLLTLLLASRPRTPPAAEPGT